MTPFILSSLSVNWVLSLLLFCVFPCQAALLVGNTRGDVPISLYNADDDGTFAPFLPPEVALIAPDHMVLNGEMLYISHGDAYNTSAIFRMNTTDNTYDSMWATAPDEMLRPYGFAIDDAEGMMYVASFRTDQILMFEMDTGEYVGEFAAGDGTADGLCNGPNQMAIHNGMLYLTTQGSVAVDDAGTIEYLYDSQIIVYDLETAVGEVYLPPPEVLPGSLGFVSMLGIIIDGCDEDTDGTLTSNCTMYTTDFGGGLRAYDLETAELLYASETSIDGASTGSLTLTENGTMIVIPIFTEDTSGTLLMFDVATGAPMGMAEGSPVLVGPTTELMRPVAVLEYDMVEDDGGSTEMMVPTAAPGSPTAVPASVAYQYSMGCTSMLATAVVVILVGLF